MEFDPRKCQQLLLCSIFFMILQHSHQTPTPKVPCYFVFGDSILDNGNNNNLATLSKSNYLPYGIDFPEGPTGRFTNDFNIADIIGFGKSVPPYALVNTSSKIVQGANYASGGAGILDGTSRNQGQTISLRMQVENHGRAVMRITQIFGNSRQLASAHLQKCLYLFDVGSNDYLNNYFSAQPSAIVAPLNPQQFADLLVQRYVEQLKNLYRLGARKVAIFGLTQIGCTPLVRSRNGNISCVNKINSAVQDFNVKLLSAIDTLNRLMGAKFSYINAYDIQAQISLLLGVTLKNAACCQYNRTTGLCIPNSVPCLNRNGYFFWDAIHPTEALYKPLAERAYNAKTPLDAHPHDISQLVA